MYPPLQPAPTKLPSLPNSPSRSTSLKQLLALPRPPKCIQSPSCPPLSLLPTNAGNRSSLPRLRMTSIPTSLCFFTGRLRRVTLVDEIYPTRPQLHSSHKCFASSQTSVHTQTMSAPPPSPAAGSSAEVQAAAFADDPRYACFPKELSLSKLPSPN